MIPDRIWRQMDPEICIKNNHKTSRNDDNVDDTFDNSKGVHDERENIILRSNGHLYF